MKRRAVPKKAAAAQPLGDASSGGSDAELAELVGLPTKRSRRQDDSDDDDSDMDVPRPRARAARDDDEDEDKAVEETPDEMRVRLARQYLDSLGINPDLSSASSSEGSDDDDLDADDKLNATLRKRALRAQGKEPRRAIVPHMLARAALVPPPETPNPLTAMMTCPPRSTMGGFKGEPVPFGPFPSLFTPEDVRVMRAHRLPPTCLALEEDDTTAYSGSKDSSIVRYNIETGSKSVFHPGARASSDGKGHVGEILAMSLSSDGVYLATGGRDKAVRIWDTRSQTQVECFRQHMDVVSCLSFRRDSLALYTGSYDRTVNVYNIEEMAYVEPLYGHQSPVTALTSLYQERAYTVSEDRTMRVWKIPQESQLLFRAAPQVGSLDTVAALGPDTVLTGAQDGSIQLWNTGKRRPQDMVKDAHGPGNWISAAAGLYASDLCATGSCDGWVRFWRASLTEQNLSPVAAVPIAGWVNGIAIGRRARFAVAAVGQEHRLGRWKRIPAGRCGVHVIDLSKMAGTAGERGAKMGGALGSADSEDDDDDNDDDAGIKRGLASADTGDDEQKRGSEDEDEVFGLEVD